MANSSIRIYSPDGKQSKMVPLLDVKGWMSIHGWLLEPPKATKPASDKAEKTTTRKKKTADMKEEVKGVSEVSKDDAVQ